MPLGNWLVVMMPLVMPLPPLIMLLPPLDLSTLHCLLSADASPPVCHLFASWLPCCPCCCIAASSHLLMHRLCLHLATCHCLLSTSPPSSLSFAGWLSCCILLRCLHLTSPFVVPPPHVSILDPPLHSHWLVIAMHLIVLPLPLVLLSTPPPHVAPATPPPVRSFAPTGCHVASCGTSASHPPACPPLCLCLLLRLTLDQPD